MSQHKTRHWSALAAILASGALVAACNSGSSSSTDDEEATFSLAVTDAPVDEVQEVWVRFHSLEFNPQDGEPFEILVDEAPDAVDLLSLQGSESADLVTEEAIPAGTYNWIRLKLDADEANDPLPHSGASWLVLKDGSEEPLRIPSGGTRGFQLNMPGGETIEDGQALRLVVDVDLRKSLVKTGNEQYLFRPVLRVISLDNVGHLDVFAPPAACETESPVPAVYVYEGETDTFDDIAEDQGPLTTATHEGEDADDVNEDGNWTFRFGFLEPETYTLALVCNADVNGQIK
ncbi:DUF4382 domain-containing protein [Alkalilimnicola ehrlichii]|uniref:DUF4382 domain-containing protein n=1 Tax=Alkalilimnicola ehrlichii TaxID=351052 RepID=UPI003BA2EC20